jgi:hypothetical protein
MARTRRIITVPALLLVAACTQASVPPSPWSADAVRELLEQDPAARMTLAGAVDDPLYCGVDVLGGSPDGRYAYVWADCETFTVVDGRAEPRSGTAAPVRVDTVERSIELPGDGAAYSAGVRRLFPPGLVDQVLEQDVTVDRTQAELVRRAVADLARG